MNVAHSQCGFLGGKIGIHSEGLGNFYSPTQAGTVYYKRRQAEPKAELLGLYPTGPGGSKGVTRNTQGSFGYTAIPATVGKDAERVKELLRVLDYLASPFGSEEWYFLNYGVEGTDHQVSASGVPVLNDRRISERGDLTYVMANTPRPFIPAPPHAVRPAQLVPAHILNIRSAAP